MIKSNWGRVLLSGASLAVLGAWGSIASPALAQEVADEIVVTATGRSAAIQNVPLAVSAYGAEQLENAGVQDLRDLQQVATSYKFYTGQSNSAGTTAYVRGIGTGADNPGFESAVGFFIDGVYRNRSGVALSSLPEVDRIEVLRGPQGTLFGRNTTAGAISVVTAGPEFEPHYWMSGTAGDYNLAAAAIGATGPIIADTLAYRLDGSMMSRDGYIDDVNSGRDLNDRNRWSARGQLLWDITPDASLRIIADAAQTDEKCCVGVTGIHTGPIPNAIQALAGVQGLTGLVLPANPEDYDIALSPNRVPIEQVEEWGVSGHLDWSFDNGMDFTSITAYRDWESVRDQDIDFSGIDRAYRDDYTSGFETFTQEFRLHGENGRLDWLVGAFYGKENLDLIDTVRFGNDAAAYVDLLAAGNAVTIYSTATADFIVDALLNPPADGSPNLPPVAGGALIATAPLAGGGQRDVYKVETTTFALFTHNEVALTDQLTLTVGLRYNHEEKDFAASIRNVGPQPALSSCALLNSGIGSGTTVPLINGLGPLLPLVCSPAVNEQAIGDYDDKREEDEYNGIVSLSYQATPDLMVYGSYSRGYKAGGFNLDRLGFNYAITGGPPAGPLATTPDATVSPSSDDLEFEPEFVDAYELGAKWQTFNGALTLNAAIFLEEIQDYQNNAFTGFNFQTFNVPETVSKGVELEWLARFSEHFTWQGGLMYNDAYFDSTVVLPGEVLEAGTPIDRASEWVATSALTYEHPVTEDLVALFYLDGRYQSEHRVQVLSRNPLTDNDGYATFNARVGLGAADDRWGVELFVNNLTDEFYNLGAFAVPEQTSGGQGVWAVYPSEPRMWGVTVRARY